MSETYAEACNRQSAAYYQAINDPDKVYRKSFCTELTPEQQKAWMEEELHHAQQNKEKAHNEASH
jgi:hypothetical protein